MKIGREQTAGLIVAMEWYLSKDFTAEFAARDRQVARILEELADVSGIGAARAGGVREEPKFHPFEVPGVLIKIVPTSMNRDEIVRRLKEGNPPVHLLPVGRDIAASTQGPRLGGEDVVATRIREGVSVGTAVVHPWVSLLPIARLDPATRTARRSRLGTAADVLSRIVWLGHTGRGGRDPYAKPRVDS